MSQAFVEIPNNHPLLDRILGEMETTPDIIREVLTIEKNEGTLILPVISQTLVSPYNGVGSPWVNLTDVKLSVELMDEEDHQICCWKLTGLNNWMVRAKGLGHKVTNDF